MAILAITGVGETSATLYIDELNMTTTYKNIRITCNGYTSPNLAKSTISRTSNEWYPPFLQAGTTYSVTWSIESSGGSTASGSGSFTTTAKAKPRPSEWGWSNSFSSGYSINVTASDWNNFCNRINQFRDFKGLPTLTYTTAYYSSRITAAQYNQARSAIASMGAVPSAVYTSSNIYPIEFRDLRDALNAIY